MIGTQENAALALDFEAPLLSSEGTTRMVFLIDGVVYKVARDGYEYCNEAEYRNFLNRERFELAGFRIPETHLFDNGVIAMEYIPGMPTGECFDVGSGCECGPLLCMADDETGLLRDLNFFDIAYGNIMEYEGDLYLIDFST